MKTAAALLLLALPACSASLSANIHQLLESTPGSRSAFWGIRIVDLGSGKTLFDLNPDHNFTPASNAKLFTTALALTRLGPDYTFETRVLAAVAPDGEGRIAGDLRLIGGGDPNLSARAIPYRTGPMTGNPLAAIEELADQVVAHGVRRIDGDIVGDDTRYTWQPYAPGWTLDYPVNDDGPPVSALTLTDNSQLLHVLPGAVAGDAAALTFTPAIGVYDIENRVRTVAVGGPRAIHFKRIPGSRYAQLWGTIPLRDKGVDLAISVEDPAQYAAEALRVALQQRGVTVAGTAVAQHLYPGEPAPDPPAGIELAKHVSVPLIEDLRITAKVSQNLHAELALRAVGRARRDAGTFDAGMEEMADFLTEVGVEPTAYTFSDASGLSRLDMVTPAAVVRVLRHMYASPARDTWVSLLPVGAQDGTLSNRFGQTAGANRVHAKTGSLSHVSALSGYIERTDGTWVAFSIVVNNFGGPVAGVRTVMDGICELILQ